MVVLSASFFVDFVVLVCVPPNPRMPDDTVCVFFDLAFLVFAALADRHVNDCVCFCGLCVGAKACIRGMLMHAAARSKCNRVVVFAIFKSCVRRRVLSTDVFD